MLDDYAHHPTETTATLSGIRSGWKRRLIAVFQPHLYSRTRDFHEDFGRAFLESDVLVVTDVYPAREEPIEGVTGKLVADAAQAAGHRQVTYIPNRNDVAVALNGIVKSGDLVIMYGAGNIHQAGMELLDMLTQQESI